MPTISRYQCIGLAWSHAARAIDRQLRRVVLRPSVQCWLYHFPCGFNAVGALEQGRVARHAIVDQCFIAGVRFSLEIIPVVELHLNATHAYTRSWDLRIE